MACRNRKGQFTSRCGKGRKSVKRRRLGKSCKFGKSKTTGRCLKHRRARR